MKNRLGIISLVMSLILLIFLLFWRQIPMLICSVLDGCGDGDALGILYLAVTWFIIIMTFFVGNILAIGAILKKESKIYSILSITILLFTLVGLFSPIWTGYYFLGK